MRTRLSNLAFSLLILAAVLLYDAWIGPPRSTIRVLIDSVAAGALLALAVAGIRFRHQR